MEDFTDLTQDRTTQRSSSSALRREVQRSRRHSFPVSMGFFDLDNFKRLNDTRGHLEGDRVLIKTAALVRETLREMDIPARYGGEEFAVILPDTSKKNAAEAAEKIRAAVARAFAGKERRMTVSVGVAAFPDDGDGSAAIVRAADDALYQAKGAGRNRVAMAGAHLDKVVS